MAYQPQNQNLETGVLAGCGMSINADPLKYDIAAGKVTIRDWSDATLTRLKILIFDGATALVPPGVPASIFTRVFLIEDPADDTKAIVEQISQGEVNNVTRREKVALPIVLHQANNSIVNGFSEDVPPAFGWAQSSNDVAICRRACNEGNVIVESGTGLQLNKGAGVTAKNFINAANSLNLNPALRDNIAATDFGFVYQSIAVTFIAPQRMDPDPDNYDNGAAIVAVGSGNKWTIQDLYFFGQSDTYTIAYGQEIFTSFADAVAAVNTKTVVEPPNAPDGVLRASLILKQGATIYNGTTVIVNH